MHDFTVADLVQTALASLAFLVFLLSPGYLIGAASNLWGFRTRGAAEKFLFAAAYSVAVTPILSVLLTRFASYNVTIAFFLLLALMAGAVLLRGFSAEAVRMSAVQRSTWIVLAMMLAWFVVVEFSLADLQVGKRLYVNYVAYDYSVRVPLVESAARSGVPPVNPFYGVGGTPVLRNYYYWYVVCALPMRLFGLPAKACLNASVFWSALCLASLIPLFLKHFYGEREELRSKSVVGIALLAVTGLDLLPFAALGYSFHSFPADMEWWDPNQVASWLGSLLWVPHHVASLTACMAGLLAFASVDRESSRSEISWAAAISGLAFASAAGLSAYVTATFAAFALVWAVVVLLKRDYPMLVAGSGAAVIAVVLSIPYLSDLLTKPEAAGVAGTASVPSEHFAFFALRDFPLAADYLVSVGVQNPFLLKMLNIPLLLIIYVLEFGFFILIAAMRLRLDWKRRGSLGRQQQMSWVMLAVCLLMMSVVKSEATGANDLGFRGMLVVQFVLLLWAAPLTYEIYKKTDLSARLGVSRGVLNATCAVAMVLGVTGTIYQIASLRFYPVLADSGRVQRTENFLGYPEYGARTYLLREEYGRLNEVTPVTASVQYNPLGDEVLMNHLYSSRQAVMGDESCMTAFGGDPARCKSAAPYIVALFNNPQVARGWDPDEFCRSFKIDVLVATETDPVWQDASSWVWTRPTLLANPAMRAIPCGAGASLPAVR